MAIRILQDRHKIKDDLDEDVLSDSVSLMFADICLLDVRTLSAPTNCTTSTSEETPSSPEM